MPEGAAAQAGLAVRREGDGLTLAFSGDWTTGNLAARERELAALDPAGLTRARLDLGAVERLDTAGAWLVWRTRARLGRQGLEVALVGSTPARDALIEKAGARAEAPAPPAPPGLLTGFLLHVGMATVATGAKGYALLNFLGLTVVALLRALGRPRRLRFTSLVYHMEKIGIDALPIVGLLSFLIGVVLAYQGADQLARFGAQVFTANLVGIAVLREMGILLTAIIVAGRSGSAFTAQIGTMNVNQEVDALRTIGLDPVEVLVLPRVLALVLVLPLLTFYADVMGLLGGAVMANLTLDIGFVQFVRQLHAAVGLWAFWVGLIKAPIFAFIIALVGCFEGLQVSSSAESVGLHTTRAVVEAIFLVIVLDALFSVFFSVVGV